MYIIFQSANNISIISPPQPSNRFIKEPHDYHMIAYRMSDVKFDFSNKSIE